jgi:hypothetical protein
MSKVERYREILLTLPEWDAFLLAQSGLPGPRGNLELAQAVVDVGERALFLRYLSFDAETAPTNTPGEFLAFCGVAGLGRLLAEGDRSALAQLRPFAADCRWRLREAVAMALQRWGMADMEALLDEMKDWAAGTPWEQRAAAAGLCEPALLSAPSGAARTLQLLDDITTSVGRLRDRRGDDFKALRKGLGYCWSVAVVAAPEIGKPLMERWLLAEDSDIRWIMRENLRKARLTRMDADWVADWTRRLEAREQRRG